MNRLLNPALVIVLVSLCAPLARARGSSPLDRAEDPRGLTFFATVLRTFGETQYTMDALTEDPRNPGELVPIRSELEFPLEATLLGIHADWRSRTTIPWSFGAGVQVSIDDASEPMTDSDFFGDKQVFFAESDPEVDLLMTTAQVRYRLRGTDRHALALFLRIDYERIEQSVVGFEGWQGSLFSDFRADVIETEPALEYEVNYLSSNVGASCWLLVGRRFELAAGGGGGLLFAWDEDDHLLRERLSKGRAVGFALLTEGRLGWRPPVFGGERLRLDLWGALRYYRAEGDVDQTYYAESSAGANNSNLPYTFESIQPQVGVSVSLALR